MYLIADDQPARIVLYDHIFGAHLLGLETGEVTLVNHMTVNHNSEICSTSLRTLFWNFSLMICNFLLFFSHSKNIPMSTLITIIIAYYLLTINYYHANNYKMS